MRLIWLATAASALTIAPAGAAQDLSPALDPVQVGQGLVLKHMVESHARSAAAARSRPGPTARQVAACAQRQRFVAQHGAADPRVRTLQRLCRNAGL